MAEIEKTRFIALPPYAFDTSRSLIAKVDEFSTTRFDSNTYSVPFNYGRLTQWGGGSMSTINPTKETIKLYAKQLRIPSFSHYEDVIRQLENSESYEHFLSKLMQKELAARQENQQKRKVRAAKFPYFKTIDDFDFDRLEHVSKACIWELDSCDFIKNRQNIVMIGNTGSGKTHTSIGLGLKACNAGFNVKFYTVANLENNLSEALQYNRLSNFVKI